MIYDVTLETQEIHVYEYGTEPEYLIKVYGPEDEKEEEKPRAVSYEDLVRLWVPDYY